VVGFYPAGQSVLPGDDKRFNIFSRDTAIDDIVSKHDVNQIIVAVKEQRGGNVPMDQLLQARIQGIPGWTWPPSTSRPPVKCPSTA
jgi:hypothetical protein